MRGYRVWVMQSCIFCRSQKGESIPFGETQDVVCPRCALQLGTMINALDQTLLTIWPALIDEDLEPEPMVRLSDGRRVELRQHTAELKTELTVEQRAELANTYVKIGLLREAILEAAHVLQSGVKDASGKVIGLLFQEPLSAPDAIERVRPFLLPV